MTTWTLFHILQRLLNKFIKKKRKKRLKTMPNTISAWKSKNSNKMGRNNDKSGRKGPITISKKGNKYENGSQKRTHKWLKNT